MAALRVECDDANKEAEDLKTRVKTLEQENLAKEQEITSLTHKNSLLEAEVEKLESAIKDAKAAVDEGRTQGTQYENVNRKLQVLEEEAEEADRTLRETNEKYVYLHTLFNELQVRIGVCGCLANVSFADFVRPTSKPATSNVRCRLSNYPTHSGKQSTKKCLRSTMTQRRSCMTSSPRLAISEAQSSRCLTDGVVQFAINIVAVMA